MNPARRLLSTLSIWQAEHNSAAQSVGATRKIETLEGLQIQLDALADLRELEEKLDILERSGVRVAVARRYIWPWRQMVLGYPEGWMSQADPDEVYPLPAIDQLETLADRLDERLPELSPTEKSKLASIVADAFELLDADETLSQPLKLYLARVLGEIKNALVDEKYGERFDYQEAARRLWVTLMAAAQESSDETQKPRWRDNAARFAWDVSANALGSAPSVLLPLTGLM